MTLDGHLRFLKLRKYWSAVLIWAQLLTASMQGFDQAGSVPAFSQCSVPSLQLYSSRAEFPCREKDWSSSLGLLWSHDLHTWLMRHSWGIGLFFSVSRAHMCEYTPSAPRPPHTLAPHPRTCLCIGYLWKDCKKPVTVTISEKEGMESWGIGVEKPLFQKTIEFCFKFIMIVEYPINTKEYIEYVLQQLCIQYTNPWHITQPKKQYSIHRSPLSALFDLFLRKLFCLLAFNCVYLLNLLYHIHITYSEISVI